MGPLPNIVIGSIRSRLWGDIDGVAELPTPLPPPKKAKKTWFMASLSLVFSIIFFHSSLSSQPEGALYPITSQSQSTIEEVAIRFDIDDMAVVHIFMYNQGGLSVIHENLLHQKGDLATRDGRYFMKASVDRLFVVSTPFQVQDWDAVMSRVNVREDVYASLRKQVLQFEPRAGIIASKKRRRVGESSFVGYVEDWLN